MLGRIPLVIAVFARQRIGDRPRWGEVLKRGIHRVPERKGKRCKPNRGLLNPHGVLLGSGCLLGPPQSRLALMAYLLLRWQLAGSRYLLRDLL
ncbi:hypothetical protein U1Q18_004466, partial [Sarracenia purpurea var. burkii]